MFYPGSGPLDGSKTLRPAGLYLIIRILQELIYHEIGEAASAVVATCSAESSMSLCRCVRVEGVLD